MNGLKLVKKNPEELILGEISYGPLDETYKHTTEDRIKIGKGAKDSLDSISRKYSKSPNYNSTNLKIFLLHSHGTELEFLIVDKKYSPMFRMRKLASIEIPFKKGSNLLELIKAAHTFRSLIEETLVNIRLFHKRTKNEDNDGEEESESGDDDETNEENEIGEILTFNTPILKKRKGK
ncbi:17_t:CDS:2 [Gigaspora rosea]|nr:17_t:CDS:2 [Gigaspora rosea]